MKKADLLLTIGLTKSIPKMLYILKGHIYRSKGNTKNLVQVYEEFRHENLITARENCFQLYQSHIDVFLQGVGKEYSSHKQAEIDLQDYIRSYKKTTKLGLPYIENGIGINISFVYDDTIEYQKEDVIIDGKKENVIIYKEEICIHGLENEDDHDLKSIYLKNLKLELDFYKKENLEIKEEIKGEINTIKTPIDYYNL